ncbi:MAG: tRNA (adenosine(37)-N6)-threonylcarbamoyltransferase complex transferase subunit TsaD [Thermodesulfobacteriota bacterium]|nr:tRNA (adenosine(37)-N6)-threonylcarbamoyltransferase complex transferase subunit TsaD [Thermodesulfobacteriota bacterium]
MIVLGIESSCDETAAAVVADGNRIVASIVASQVDIHHPYGGVVPELASRRHVEVIVSVVDQALAEAGLDPSRIDAVAVTRGPGLVGALLVGFSFAKAYAYALEKPWVGVNHLEGHINSVFLASDPPTFPFVALLASGGHTSLYYVTDHIRAELMGQTRDDAAGEAFDKVAKLLGLGYPGGRIIGQMAEKGTPGRIVFPRPYLDRNRFDFSFSGLKSAVRRHVQVYLKDDPNAVPDIAAEFQEAVVDVLTDKLIRGARHKKCDQIALVGGVAANQRLRKRLLAEASRESLAVHIPPIDLCQDNAAMIAAVGYHYLQAGFRGDLADDVYSRTRI